MIRHSLCVRFFLLCSLLIFAVPLCGMRPKKEMDDLNANIKAWQGRMREIGEKQQRMAINAALERGAGTYTRARPAPVVRQATSIRQAQKTTDVAESPNDFAEATDTTTDTSATTAASTSATSEVSTTPTTTNIAVGSAAHTIATMAATTNNFGTSSSASASSTTASTTAPTSSQQAPMGGIYSGGDDYTRPATRSKLWGQAHGSEIILTEGFHWLTQLAANPENIEKGIDAAASLYHLIQNTPAAKAAKEQRDIAAGSSYIAPTIDAKPFVAKPKHTETVPSIKEVAPKVVLPQPVQYTPSSVPAEVQFKEAAEFVRSGRVPGSVECIYNNPTSSTAPGVSTGMRDGHTEIRIPLGDGMEGVFKAHPLGLFYLGKSVFDWTFGRTAYQRERPERLKQEVLQPLRTEVDKATASRTEFDEFTKFDLLLEQQARLHIQSRYSGTEFTPEMTAYNAAYNELGNDLQEVNSTLCNLAARGIRRSRSQKIIAQGKRLERSLKFAEETQCYSQRVKNDAIEGYRRSVDNSRQELIELYAARNGWVKENDLSLREHKKPSAAQLSKQIASQSSAGFPGGSKKDDEEKKRETKKVANIKEFFKESEFGKELEASSKPTDEINQIMKTKYYEVQKNMPEYGIKKGDKFCFDNAHNDHIEVVRGKIQVDVKGFDGRTIKEMLDRVYGRPHPWVK
jgi:hypothetical protein